MSFKSKFAVARSEVNVTLKDAVFVVSESCTPSAEMVMTGPCALVWMLARQKVKVVKMVTAWRIGIFIVEMRCNKNTIKTYKNDVDS